MKKSAKDSTKPFRFVAKENVFSYRRERQKETDSRQRKNKKIALSGSLRVLSGEKAGEGPGGGFIGIVEGLYSSIPITKSTGVSVPSSELGPLFPPPQASVAPPLDLRGGGATFSCG
jgi:hypothetical protein